MVDESCTVLRLSFMRKLAMCHEGEPYTFRVVENVMKALTKRRKLKYFYFNFITNIFHHLHYHTYEGGGGRMWVSVQ